MTNFHIAVPVISAPSNRRALGVGWVRPGVAGIGGTLNPSATAPLYGTGRTSCFGGNDE